jgi:hypothetical protein
MIYRGPGFPHTHPLLPSESSTVDKKGRLRKRDTLLTGDGDRGFWDWGAAKSYDGEKACKVLYKPFNILCSHMVKHRLKDKNKTENLEMQKEDNKASTRISTT